MRYLVVGGCGFLGSNLASEVLRRGETLAILDNLSRRGASDNLNWLKSFGEFQFFHGDTRSSNDVHRAVAETRPGVIFHVAGQVAMTTSLANPRLDFETNAIGTLNVLEAARAVCPDAVLIYSSTNKVYGDLDQFRYEENATRYVCPGYEMGFDEALPLDFRSPYGCSKGAADQYVLDYARCFDLRTIVFRHSSIFGGRQFSTYDNGWIGWFVQKALDVRRGEKKPFTISGDGKQVRDVLFANDLIRLYFAGVERIDEARGQPFNIGGGPLNSLSLLELFDFLSHEMHLELRFERLPWRKSDQKVFVADIRKAGRLLKWEPALGKVDGLRRMIEWESRNG